MKKKLLLPALLLTILFGACKKGSSVDPDPTTTTATTTTEVATEGTIVIADNTSNTVKYDDKTITAKTFAVEKVLTYIYASSQQITVQSTEKDGIFYKYNLGLTVL